MNLYINKKNSEFTARNSYGFTLVETLVAIAVLLVAIVGPMTIVSQGLQASFFARERTTAIYLAQEGLESIQKLRDEQALSVINGNASEWVSCQNDPTYTGYSCGLFAATIWNWYADLNFSADCEGNGCDYDPVTRTFHECQNVDDCRLHIDADISTGHYYQYTETGTPSQFTRVITLSEDPDPHVEALITVEVTWDSSLVGISTVRLDSRLFSKYE